MPTEVCLIVALEPALKHKVQEVKEGKEESRKLSFFFCDFSTVAYCPVQRLMTGFSGDFRQSSAFNNDLLQSL